MFGRLKNKRGQSTAEYAILIGLIVTVAIGIQTYVKRGLQARQKDVADDYVTALSTDANWSSISSTAATVADQFEHGKLSSQSTQQTLEDEQTSTMLKDGTVTRDSTRKTKQAVGDKQKYDRY